MSIQKTTLPNGVRILTERMDHVGSASIGLWCRTGSSDELPHEAGITHLIEHMLFKGTPTRTAKQIAEEIEGRGGILNAFTDKQTTCYYCSVLAEDAPVSVDVLSDMMRNSLLDPAELAKERQVVIEEIRRGEDDPESNVHDLHMQNRWKGHQLGLPIIGTRESVGGFQRENLAAYMERRYRGGHILLAGAGRVDHDQMVRWAEEKLGSIPAGEESTVLTKPSGGEGEHYEGKDVEQVHFCLGGDAPGLMDDRFHTVQVLNEILGGGMSSRLWHEVREQRGLAYSVGSYTAAYTAGGAFTIYGGTSLETWPQVKEVIRQELDKMMEEGPSDEELARAKKSLSGSMVLGLEGTGARMRRMSRIELAFRREIPLDETVSKLNAVTRDDLMSLSQEIFPSDRLTTTVIGPRS